VNPQALHSSYSSLINELVSAVAGISYDLGDDAELGDVAQILNSNLLTGGKRIRPMLCLLVGKAFRLSNDTLAPFARAAELTHCASLAHDDVIDRSATRRGRPTLHTVVGETRAVLSGDLLLAQVILELLDASSLSNRVAITRDLAQAIRELSLGEWLETEARGRIPATAGELDRILELKTGSLTRWCAQVAPMLAGASPQVVSECASFGLKVGLAFQMMDDVLDFEKGTGKPFAQDIQEGVINTVSFELIRRRNLGPEFWNMDLSAEWISEAQTTVRTRCAVILAEAQAHLTRAIELAAADGIAVDPSFIHNGELSGFLALITSRKT
jgi:geranylgeranyl pyrophosphate synthase